MSREIEAKFRVADLAAAREALLRAGGTFVRAVLQTDIYFDTPDGTLLASDCGLRLRTEELARKRGSAGSLDDATGHAAPLSLKGSDSTAQGEALGAEGDSGMSPVRAAQGRSRRHPVPPLQGSALGGAQSQGYALGWRIPALRAEELRKTGCGFAFPALLTYKGPRRTRGRAKSRVEIQTTVEDPQAIEKILRALGLVRRLVIQKRRSSYRLGRCLVELDELPILGCFVEIEGASSRVIESAARRLGLAGSPLKVHYLQLAEDACPRAGRQCLEITFARCRGCGGGTPPGPSGRKRARPLLPPNSSGRK